ncbi:IS66 family transposase zinc-finger binding domain-containing protein [Mesorhizobium sp. ORM8.1]
MSPRHPVGEFCQHFAGRWIEDVKCRSVKRRRRQTYSAGQLPADAPITRRAGRHTPGSVPARPAVPSGWAGNSDDECEVLEYVPSHFKVVVHVRPKLSCRIARPSPSRRCLA